MITNVQDRLWKHRRERKVCQMIPQQEPQLLICRIKRKTCQKLWIILGLPVQPQWENSLSTLTIQVFSHRSKLLHWIFNPFLLSRLLLSNIVYINKNYLIFYQLVEVFLEALIQTPQTTAWSTPTTHLTQLSTCAGPLLASSRKVPKPKVVLPIAYTFLFSIRIPVAPYKGCGALWLNGWDSFGVS